MDNAVSGSKLVFKLDNNAGALVDLSQYIQRVNMPMQQDVHDTTTADGTGHKSEMLGLKGGAEFGVEALYHTTFDAHICGIYNLITGVSQTYEYGPDGSGAGKRKFSGECFLKSFAPDSNAGTGAPTTYNVTLIQHGTQIVGVWP